MDALFNIIATIFMLLAVYFMVKTPGNVVTTRYMRRAGLCLLVAAAAQLSVAALRTWGSP